MIKVAEKYKNRESQAELLRIVCMFFIVMHHFLAHGLYPETFDLAAPLTGAKLSSLLANGFLSVGVNCFILISGYYSIRFKWKSLLNLYLTCAFYGLLGYLAYLVWGEGHFGGGILWNTLFIFSHGDWWFISCYLCLMFLSPILNAGMNHLEKGTYITALILLTILNVYFGYCWKLDAFNATGYTTMQFIYVYMIGGYIKRFITIDSLSNYRWVLISIYIISDLLWAGLSVLNNLRPFGYVDYVYNNPLILIASISFFGFMMSFRFKNVWVNWLSGGVLAAYLLQDHQLVRPLLYPLVAKWLLPLPLSIQYLSLVGVSVAFLLLILLLDKIRQIPQDRILKYLPEK